MNSMVKVKVQANLDPIIIKKRPMPRRSTRLKVDKNLWREFRILAIRERTTATNLLIQLIRELAAKKRKAKQARKA